MTCCRQEIESYTTSSLISDGIDYDMNHENPLSYLRMGLSSRSLLYGQESCHSLFGFFPCANTMPQGVFLMIMYTYLMILGEDWIRKGSQALSLLLGDKAFGASVYRVLMALPRIILVIVIGVLSTESNAQYQVAFGVSMYAGSTLITLTLIWGLQIILSRDSKTNTGVNIDKVTGDIAKIMLLSLIPFTIVELVSLIKSPVMILFALAVSGISLVLYFAYQILNPWIQVRSLAYLKQENLIKDFDNDLNCTIEKHEFVQGFIKWIEKTINHDHSIKDPQHAITIFEEDILAETDTPMNTVKPKASIVYVIFGVTIMYLVSGAFMLSILQFSNATHIPFNLTSFVVFPVALNARMLITTLLNVGPRYSMNASLAFSEMYSGLVMNNLLGLLTLLTVVYMKGLSWTYSNEMLTIMIPCAIVGLFALKRDTYPLWAAISAMLLYPIFIFLYYVY